jgi:hypothetical protein
MRGIWGLLAAIHLWPGIAILSRVLREGAPADLLTLGLLLLIITLFVLKAADVHFLRLRHPGLDLLVFVVAAALVHGNVVTRNGQPALAETATTAAIAASAVALGTPRIRRRVTEFLRACARRTRPDRLHGGPLVAVLRARAWRWDGDTRAALALARAPPLSHR